MDNDVLAQYGAVNSGNSISNSASIRERMSRKFKPHEFVRVKNIDSQEFKWVYALPEEELVEQPDRATRHVIHPQPKVYSMKAGEERVLPGHHAYIFIEKLYKIMTQKGYGDKKQVASHMSNPKLQDEHIEAVVVGITDAMQAFNTQANVSTEDEVAKDLGLTDGDSAKKAKK